VGTRQDLHEALELAAEGKIKPTIELQPLDAINQVFDRLKQGKVEGRVVLQL
jgi:alcohol dehydrogenase, propanol-preferring